jgi:hypothetical protein
MKNAPEGALEKGSQKKPHPKGGVLFFGRSLRCVESFAQYPKTRGAN